jgi:thiamine biosynthesis lipoprotein
MQEFADTKKLMGTDVSVSVVSDTESRGQEIADEVCSKIYFYEQKFSRFIPDSELSMLNKVGSMVMSDEFLAVLKQSYELYIKTQGAFNPLLQIARHGYNTSYAKIGTHIQKQSTETYDTDFSTVLIDKRTSMVTLQPTQQLDFNGILKGYVATKLSHHIQFTYPDCKGLIVNIGGDLHTFGLDEESKAFEFLLYNPVTKEETPIQLTNKALVTSGTYHRKWKTDTGEMHHILDDTGTNNPTTDIVSASVIHDDGATAEAYATLLIVAGIEKAKTIINTNTFNYWLVKTNGEVITNIL